MHRMALFPRNSMCLTHLALVICMLFFQGGAATAQQHSWYFYNSDFGPTATGLIKEDGRRYADYKVTAVGVFCGTPLLNPGKINLYLYGLEYERLATGIPVKATVVVDGDAQDLTFETWGDIVFAAVSSDFAHKLIKARSLSVFVKDYDVAKADEVTMTGSAVAIRRVLRHCL